MLTPLLAERLVPMNLPERAREFWSRLAPRGERERAICAESSHFGGRGEEPSMCVWFASWSSHIQDVCVWLWDFWECGNSDTFFSAVYCFYATDGGNLFLISRSHSRVGGWGKEKRLLLGIFPQTSQGWSAIKFTCLMASGPQVFLYEREMRFEEGGKVRFVWETKPGKALWMHQQSFDSGSCCGCCCCCCGDEAGISNQIGWFVWWGSS